MSVDAKKTFLLKGSLLFDAMIRLTDQDVIRRYLAFRIIVNAMSFEDLVGRRVDARMREIRNVLLAHKQEAEFFEGYKAAGEIDRPTIDRLLEFMRSETDSLDPAWLLPELAGGKESAKFQWLVPQVFQTYVDDFLSGHRIINNFLCFTGGNIQEITSGPLPGVFYRYHSSKALYDLSEYLFNNAFSDPDLVWLARHSKLDMLLHAQNLADCAVKDRLNNHSIDGLLEVMVAENIGDASSLQALQGDTSYKDAYSRVRSVRNKLVGHMDKRVPLTQLITLLDALSEADIHLVVNETDKAIHAAAASHIAIKMRYATGNQVLNNSNIVDIAGIQVPPF